MSVLDEIKTANLSFSGCDMVASITAWLPNNKTIFRTIGSLQTLTYSIHMDKKPIRSVGNVNAKDYVFGPRTIAGTLIFAVFNKHFTHDFFNEIREEEGDILANCNLVADEMPPFDITITLANEYGVRSTMVIYGVRIVNEGQTMSINDIYTENTYQYVATDIDYLDSGKKPVRKIGSDEAETVTEEPDKIIPEEVSTALPERMVGLRQYINDVIKPDITVLFFWDNKIKAATVKAGDNEITFQVNNIVVKRVKNETHESIILSDEHKPYLVPEGQGARIFVPQYIVDDFFG